MLSLSARSVLSARWLFAEVSVVRTRHRAAKSSSLDVMLVDRRAGLSGYSYPTLQPFFDTLLQSPVPGQTSHPKTPGSGPVSYTPGLIPIADWSVRSWFPHHKMPVAAQVPRPGMLGAQEPTFKPELSAERHGTWFAFHNPGKMAEESSSSVY